MRMGAATRRRVAFCSSVGTVDSTSPATVSEASSAVFLSSSEGDFEATSFVECVDEDERSSCGTVASRSPCELAIVVLVWEEGERADDPSRRHKTTIPREYRKICSLTWNGVEN